MRHPSEIFVVFRPSPRLGRRVSWASDNKEVLLISTPVSRTQLPVKDRREPFGAGCGETSTHDATYTGVQTLPWGAMNLAPSQDKARILGHDSETPRPQLFDTSLGQPLFWAERKPAALFRALFADLSATAVVDVSPGSGTAARAAAEAGISYVGMGRNAYHVDWLNNAADRHALHLITSNGTPLYHQDLASCITEHFQSLLDDVQFMAKAQDTEPESGVDILEPLK